MSLISHYVVTYNHGTGKYSIDEATANCLFEDGVVYDEGESKFVKLTSIGAEGIAEDEDGAELLQKALALLNRE